MPQSSSDIRTAYDLAASAYADSFLDELLHKPRDVEHLQQFAALVGRGQRVLDLGCGPGHTTAHLASLGLKPVGVDLSPEMIAKARELFPGEDFTVGDFFSTGRSRLFRCRDPCLLLHCSFANGPTGCCVPRDVSRIET